jgi:Uma2 family endonuclease
VATVTRSKAYTFDDFCFLVKNGEKADLIDGVIYMASPENTGANDLFMWMGGLMYDFADVNDLGKVFGSRVALRLNDLHGPEPDLVFIKKKHLRRVKRGHIQGAADLALEIVSPDSIERDYVEKRALYEKAGIHEYWIVDEPEQKVTLLRLDSKGKYREVRPSKGVLCSQVLTDFWIRPEWLWQNPRPKKLDVLREIMARKS